MCLVKEKRPAPPGEMLREEFMKPLGLTQAELAAKLGMARVVSIDGWRSTPSSCPGSRSHPWQTPTSNLRRSCRPLDIFPFLRRDHSVDGVGVAAPGLAVLVGFVFVRLDFELLTQNDVQAKVLDEQLIEALEVVL
jgi:hypothetical protein